MTGRPLTLTLSLQGRGKRWEIQRGRADRKSTRLNSSHANISYAVFCLKKKNKTIAESLTPPDRYVRSIMNYVNTQLLCRLSSQHSYVIEYSKSWKCRSTLVHFLQLINV